MAYVTTLPVPGRDTCNGTCETEAGCTCGPNCTRHPDCANGCARPHCKQGRATCWGRPLAVPSIPRPGLGMTLLRALRALGK